MIQLLASVGVLAHGLIQIPELRSDAATLAYEQSHRNEVFRKAAFFFLWILIFVIPWENAILIPGFGTLSRAVGIPAFGMALLAILESGTLRTLSIQHLSCSSLQCGLVLPISGASLLPPL